MKDATAIDISTELLAGKPKLKTPKRGEFNRQTLEPSLT